MLTLMEELMLIALQDEKGTVIWSAAGPLGTALCGAALAELMLREKLLISDPVSIINTTLTDDPILDEILGFIQTKGKLKDIKWWIGELQWPFRKIDKQIAERLVLKGILRQEEAKILWLFPTHHYPSNDPAPEMQLRNRLVEIIVNQQTHDNRTLILLSLLNRCNLTDKLFETTEKTLRKQYVLWVKKLVENEPIGKAVQEKLDDDTAATMAAVTATT